MEKFEVISEESFDILDLETKQPKTFTRHSSEENQKEMLELIYKNIFFNLRESFKNSFLDDNDDNVDRILLNKIKENFKINNSFAEGEKVYIKEKIKLINIIFDSVFINIESRETILNDQFVSSLKELCYIKTNDNFKIKEKFGIVSQLLLTIIELERSRQRPELFMEFEIDIIEIFKHKHLFEICNKIFQIFPSCPVEDLPGLSVTESSQNKLSLEEYELWKNTYYFFYSILKDLIFSIDESNGEVTNYWEAFYNYSFRYNRLNTLIINATGAKKKIKEQIICWMKIYVERRKRFAILEFRRWSGLNNDSDEQNELVKNFSEMIGLLRIEEKFEKFLEAEFNYCLDWRYVEEISRNIARISENVVSMGNLYAIVFYLEEKLKKTKFIDFLLTTKKKYNSKLLEDKQSKLHRSIISLTTSDNPYSIIDNTEMGLKTEIGLKIVNKEISEEILTLVNFSEDLFGLLTLGEVQNLDNLKELWLNSLKENSWEKIDKTIKKYGKDSDLHFTIRFIDIYNCLQTINSRYEVEKFEVMLTKFNSAFKELENEEKEQFKLICDFLEGLVFYANELIKNEFWKGSPRQRVVVTPVKKPKEKAIAPSLLEDPERTEQKYPDETPLLSSSLEEDSNPTADAMIGRLRVDDSLEQLEQERAAAAKALEGKKDDGSRSASTSETQAEDKGQASSQQEPETGTGDAPKEGDKSKKTTEQRQEGAIEETPKIGVGGNEGGTAGASLSENGGEEEAATHSLEGKDKNHEEQQIVPIKSSKAGSTRLPKAKDVKKVVEKEIYIKKKVSNIKEIKNRVSNSNFFLLLLLLSITTMTASSIIIITIVRIKADLILKKLITMIKKQPKEDSKKSADKKTS